MFLWSAIGRARVGLYERGVFARKRLHSRVVSIGNLAWGGTGKTPFTLWLARRLQKDGLSISVLTRGYRRTSPDRVRLFPPGSTPEDAATDGDEVQLYVRHLSAPVGVARRRYEAGRSVEQRYPIDVHLLDDGFQHLQLARDLDLVLVPATNPWGVRSSFPFLAREGPGALRRADAVVITRCELLDGPGSRELLRWERVFQDLRPGIRVFRAGLRLLRFQEKGGGLLASSELRSLRPFAFCALGDPENFFLFLRRHHVEALGNLHFRDHHRYRHDELQRLEELARQRGAGCLLTTEKDLVNLPQGMELSLPLFWPKVEMLVEQEEEFVRWLFSRLELRGMIASDEKELELAPPKSSGVGATIDNE